MKAVGQAFEIALRDGTVDAWRRDLDAAADALSRPDVAAAVANPAISPAVREEAIRCGLSGAVGPIAVNLVVFLIRRGRIDQVPRIAAEFRRLDDERRGIVHAVATSASALEPAEVTALTQRLEQLTGGTVELTVVTDPSLLGGFVVRVGDRLIDWSVKGRLERLRNQLVSGAI